MTIHKINPQDEQPASPPERPPEAHSFSAAPLDRYAIRVTVGVAYLGGLLMLPLLFAYLSNLRWGGLLIPSALALPLAIFLLLAYAFQPVSYVLEPDALTIRRRWARNLRVPYDQISGVSVAATLADMPRYGLRFAFNPGIFGYQGPFRLDPYGQAFFLATNRERLVAIARQSTLPLIVSPERPREFVARINDERGRRALEAIARSA